MQKIVIAEAQKIHRDLISKLSTVQIEEVLNIDLHKDEISTNKVFKEKLNGITNLKKAIVYVINIIDLNDSILEEFYSKYKKENSSKFRISKFNSEFLNHSKALYVGSSTKKTIDRFKQHFGIVKQNSYGLYLSNWLNTDFNINIKIYNLKSEEFEIEKETLESIEQAFWDLNKPLFGKRSGQL